ncbi:transglutaminase-like domain-containing protein [Egicoccus halophilus]|uniref:transglutaminase-like domain-containing protein n=1 Tax=Egicoccus halophilus TaxID=1670830 RepID=UPI00103054A1|nr:transglutaminase family protein [Egicoccus halophilus]
MQRLAIDVRASWNATAAAAGLVLLQVADAAGQTHVAEHLEVEGAEVEDPGTRPDGSRPLRLHAQAGTVRLHYRADVDVAPADTVGDAPLPGLAGLDLDLQTWTLPSRYCPSDVLRPMAVALFGGGPHTGTLLEDVRAWVEREVAYVPGSSDVHTAADETMLRRAGVCRDLAHLTATLLRALNVPARLVAVYALDLEPPDFHAVVEAHDGTGWRLLDATGLASTSTLARIATGRDAAEIAWGTIDGPMNFADLAVEVTDGTQD